MELVENNLWNNGGNDLMDVLLKKREHLAIISIVSDTLSLHLSLFKFF